MTPLRPDLLASRQRLQEEHRELARAHGAGAGGRQVCRRLTERRDDLVVAIFEAALRATTAAGLRKRIALVAHGGYGRREVAPFSDVDIMILREGDSAGEVARLAERFVSDVFDAGLVLGHSVREPGEACHLAEEDATIYTSLVTSRLLAGDEGLFGRFMERFARETVRRGAALAAAVEAARREERARYGQTVYLLEPNVKRSPGGLRDLHLLGWIGHARHGTADPAELAARGLLGRQDAAALDEAGEFLLWVRNELHFRAGRAADVLDRAAQVDLAERFGYAADESILAVERFMRDYFRHTRRLGNLVERFVERARVEGGVRHALGWILGRRLGGDYRVGPDGIRATRQGLARLGGDLVEVLRLAELSSLHDKPISPATWEVVRRSAASLRARGSPEAKSRFLALLARPTRLGEILSRLHEVEILSEFVPALEHARGLLQFNQYHKYTVDEHCLRAVEWAAALAADQGPLGRVYRELGRKWLLHLALLIHDLGKGYPEEHREVGRRIARETSRQLGLSADDADTLEFLVHQHLLMNHLALRRDVDEESTAVHLAVEAGSPERLRMLYVLTAADLAAVGPDVWTSWKNELLAGLFHRALEHLAGERPATRTDATLGRRRQEVAALLADRADEPWIAQELRSLPAAYLTATEPADAAGDLRMLAALGPRDVAAQARYLPANQTVQLTIATSEDVAPGIFHRLTGAISAAGLEILSAQIHTLADRRVLDRFWTRDPDHAGCPPPERLREIETALVRSLHAPEGQRPAFRQIWQRDGGTPLLHPAAQTRVQSDNATSAEFTILDVFAADRRGLLYAITRTLHELGLSVWRAKIGTYLDQVVDVFYVTDRQGAKILDETRLTHVRLLLHETVERHQSENA